MCLGTRITLFASLHTSPEISKSSAHKYSSTAAKAAGASAVTLKPWVPYLMYLPILPIGKVIPALSD